MGLRLAAYALPGRVPHPGPVVQQARDAVELGYDTIGLSERPDSKEMGAVAGAVAVAAPGAWVYAGLTNAPTRHPLQLAGLGSTMAALTGGRFVLGIGRGVPAYWRALGVVTPTLGWLEEMAGLLRTLWSGRPVVDYRGRVGQFPMIALSDPPDPSALPQLHLGGVGPRALELAGRAFDGIMLTPFLTDEAVAASMATVRQAAEQAGRDPDRVEVWSCLVTAADLPDDVTENLVPARLLTYLLMPGYGDALVAANRWDTAPMEQVRARAAEIGYGRSGESREELRALVGLLPPSWTDGAAFGTGAWAAARVRDHQHVGVTGVAIHGSVPAQTTTLMAALAEPDGQR